MDERPQVFPDVRFHGTTRMRPPSETQGLDARGPLTTTKESSVMSKSNSKLSVPAAVTVGAVAVIALIASGVLRPSTVTGASPSSPPVASPSAPVTPVPTDDADNEQTIKLDIATDHDVFVTVKDKIAAIAGVRSGRAADGMSVGWYEMKVENITDSALRLTWVGITADGDAVLTVDELDGKIELTLVQPGPYENTDATGHDRMLILEFAFPVNADDVLHSVQGGLDTDD